MSEIDEDLEERIIDEMDSDAKMAEGSIYTLMLDEALITCKYSNEGVFAVPIGEEQMTLHQSQIAVAMLFMKIGEAIKPQGYTKSEMAERAHGMYEMYHMDDAETDLDVN